ncbi:cytochrome c-type biogenesis protein CcmF [Endobacter medicaginis]|uniref:Cytochrome c-type biogenesis protein CcmF n=2 Tax=Endobacter medicaginis TaxID=1181271 RepID=A0A839UW65_9PROT|nr:heme lyase CcmF/NrfE family subunit [Endobacter medicaginis]MBB3174067.1 cytochrome c-type biogenesis protein CcmF [Endobacter medicaginis]MCX5476065.1 heme lyase CcmF/NrfE family subunit [Endobacter medicaginis]
MGFETIFGPELGTLALACACVVALVQAVLPMIGAQRGHARLMRAGATLAGAQLFCLALSFVCLVAASVADDFSVGSVAANSAIAKPLAYKIAGVWGNHEGSILLWGLILALCGGAVAVFGRELPDALRARVLAVLGGTSAGFLLFCLLTSNPFSRVWPPPMDGSGMNPLLQDPGLAIHPPILYCGYVGFAVPFAFAVAALIEGEVDAAWGRWVRPWAVAAWAMLTCGIALGSWWSYYILGWGGYWFWDPVENASLLPWLTGTALIHSAIVVEKRAALKIWTVLLAIATFSLSLSGTFLVRSGILNSVHEFANDPTRGVFILTLLALVSGGALALFAWRAPVLMQRAGAGLFAPLSREGALVANNIGLCAICAVVLTGTMYPPFSALLFDRAISVGAPFFNLATLPLAIPLFALVALGPMLPWKRGRTRALLRRARVPLVVALAALAGAMWGMVGAVPIAVFALGVWIIAGSLADLAARVLAGGWREAGARLAHLPRGVVGAAVAHLGLGLTVLGLAAMSQARTDIVAVQPGQEVDFGGYRWTLDAVSEAPGPNYSARIATISVREGGRLVTALHPAERRFAQGAQTTQETAIHTNLLVDLYAVLGDTAPGGVVLRLHVNPLAPFLWLGALVMALGGGLSLSDRRLRVGAPRRAHPAAGRRLA